MKIFKTRGDNMIFYKLSMLMLLITISFSGISGDLDDGIGIDKPINDDLQLDINVDFIKRNAKAKAKRNTPDGDSNTLTSNSLSGPEGCDGAGNIKIGPGTDLKGVRQIINISTNKGVSTICTK